MRTIKFLTCRNTIGCLAIVVVIAAMLSGCVTKETGESPTGIPLSPISLPSVQVEPTVQPTPTLLPAPLFDPNLDLLDGPVDVPLELQIPALKVIAPVLGVGITPENVMDAPKGPIDDPIWHTAFWYRGSGIPGESGIATIAAHVNDPLGRNEIFANLGDLQPGDLIIIHNKNTGTDIRFIVDLVMVYSSQESSDPTVLARIFGEGSVNGTGPQPAPDGLSHLTLITCAGNIVGGEFDHHTVVYATHSD